MTSLKDLTYTYTPPVQTYTVRAIYGYDTFTAPEGYKFTGEFRLPIVGEQYLSVGFTVTTALGPQITYNVPRLILAPLPKRKRWVIEQVEDRPRRLEPGESGCHHSASLAVMEPAIYTNRTNIRTESEFLIVSIHEEEVAG